MDFEYTRPRTDRFTCADKEHVLKQLRKNSFYWFDCDDNLKKDRDFLTRAIPIQPVLYSLKNLGPELYFDEAFFLERISEQSYVFDYAAQEMRQNRDLILRAIALNSRVINHATHFNDDEFLLAAIYANGNVVYQIEEKLYQNIQLIWRAWRIPQSLNNDADRLDFIQQFFVKEIVNLAAELCLVSLGVFLLTFSMILGAVMAGLGAVMFGLSAFPHVRCIFEGENAEVCIRM